MNRHDLTTARVHLEHADRIDEGRAPIDEVRLEWVRATLAFYADDDAWLPAIQRCAELVEPLAPATVCYTLTNAAVMAQLQGRADVAQPLLERSLETSERHGLTYAAAFSLCTVIDNLYWRGELEAAYTRLLAACALHVETTLGRLEISSSGIPLLLDLGRIDALPGLASDDLIESAFAMQEPVRISMLAGAHAQLLFSGGDSAGAQSLIERALSLVRTPHYNPDALLRFALYGDAEQASRSCALLQRSSGPLGRLCFEIASAAMEQRSHNAAAAQSHCNSALRLADELQFPLMRAIALEVTDQVHEAIDLFRRLGAVGRVALLQREKATVLTTREQQVAELLAGGMSNRSIAEALVLSERTVEHHVASIYSKLGVKSRAAFISAFYLNTKACE